MKIRCIAIDDEPLALEKITDFIRRVDYLELMAGFYNPVEAVSFLKEMPIDLIFLDIQMDEITGIEFIETIKPGAAVILTTAHSEYALKGYELQVHDYLLKPISFKRFLRAVDTYYDRFCEINKEMPGKSDNLFVKSGNIWKNISINEILHVEGMKDYLRIWTVEGGIMTLMSFNDLMKLLPENKFCRIHRSFLVALSKIDEVTKNRVRIRDQYLPIGDTYKEKFFSLLEQG